jgi:hypothetical protein
MPIYKEIYAEKYRGIQQSSGTLAAIKALQTDICSREEIKYFSTVSRTPKELRLLVQQAMGEVGLSPSEIDVSIPLLRPAETKRRCKIEETGVVIWENERTRAGGYLSVDGATDEEALDNLFEVFLNPETGVPSETTHNLDNVRLTVGDLFEPRVVVKVLQSNKPGL